jgi:hypothetical protein
VITADQVWWAMETLHIDALTVVVGVELEHEET